LTSTLIVFVAFLAISFAAAGEASAQMELRSADPQDRPITNLRDFNQALIDIAAAVKPTVVTVSTERILTVRQRNPFSDDPFFDFFFGPRDRRQQPREREYRQQGLGSGVIVSNDGYILTNNHVIQEADSIFVRTFDGERYPAEVVGADPKTDIAVLQIEAEDLPAIPLGNSNELEVGEMVMAIGSPMSENLAYTVTQGIVSAKGRSNVGLADYEDFIQTDAAINPGNSGGPLVNLDGVLVGINTAIASRSGGFQGIGFAVPVNMATRVMNSLIEEGRVVRGWLGVTIQPIDPQLAQAMGLEETRGALVGDVLPDTPADEAGVQPGDVIIGMNGTDIEDFQELRNRIAATPPGTEVVFEVVREGERIDIPVELGELPGEIAQTGQEDLSDMVGFTVSGLTAELAERYDIAQGLTGVVVTSVDPASSAARQGLREGDVVRSVNRQRVSSVDDFNSVIAQIDEGDTVLLRVHRAGSSFFLAFRL
jgi:serine protease Do